MNKVVKTAIIATSSKKDHPPAEKAKPKPAPPPVTSNYSPSPTGSQHSASQARPPPPPPPQTPPPPPNSIPYFSKLRRLQINKHRKWFDPPSTVVELLLLPGNDSLLLAFGTDGFVSALHTENSRSLVADIDWFTILQVPSTVSKTTDICHVAFDDDSNRLFFTIYPMDSGVFQADMTEIMQKSHQPVSANAPVEESRQINNAAHGQKPKSAMNPKARRMPLAKTQTVHPPAIYVGNATKLVINGPDITLHHYIPKMFLPDGLTRWFFGMAAVKNMLFVCHRNRPNTISVWSTISESSGEMLMEIRQPSSLVDFQPFNCAALVESNCITLAVVDSYHQLFIFLMKKEGEMTAELSQTLATRYGKGSAKLHFPLGVYFNTDNNSLWIADGLNSRVQWYERKIVNKESGTMAWQHVWSSPHIPQTVIPTQGGAVLSAFSRKNEKAAPTWVRSVVIPKDSNGLNFVVVALSDKEIACLGNEF